MEVSEMNALQLSERIRQGELCTEDVVWHYKKRIELQEPELGAFLCVDENIDNRIKEVQAGIQNGTYQGGLAGVPIAIKDNICTKGLRTSCASKMLDNFVPTYHATVVERMECAGMIVLGKTNMDEFGMGSTTETSAFGVTRNPWNLEHVPGGSSGGSAAAVAAGEIPVALGTDTGGSVRQPAAYCGVVGFKPSYGRISRNGLIAYASSMDQIGSIGRTVADCKALYEVMAGYDAKDATSVKKGIWETKLSGKPKDTFVKPNADGRVHGMRIGIPKEYLDGVSLEIKEAVKAAALQLEAEGAIVEEISLPYTEYVVSTYYIIACAEASSNLARYDGVKYGYRAKEFDGLHEMYKKSRSEGFGEEVKRRILLGSFVLSEGYYDAYYLRALKVRQLIQKEFVKVFETYDCLLLPTTAGTAPKFGESLSNPLQMYVSDATTVAANLAGLPAISVPCGLDKNGLPMGVQFLADVYDEITLFQVAELYEKVRGKFPTVKKTPEKMDRILHGEGQKKENRTEGGGVV